LLAALRSSTLALSPLAAGPFCRASDVFLEELVDTAPEADYVTQTDEFLHRPPTPAFVPAKSGIDSTTQIEKGGGDEMQGRRQAV
jgi:hypothetical protein